MQAPMRLHNQCHGRCRSMLFSRGCVAGATQRDCGITRHTPWLTHVRMEDFMGFQDTKSEVLAHLDKMTRDVSAATYATFTTTRIASECHVSRSLASQYLNEFVRTGAAIKVNERPVLFFHRRAFERYLQNQLSCTEFDSMRDLLSSIDMRMQRDFDKAIGHELSCNTCVDHLKRAVHYPPHGLPALLIGDHGTGKQLMSELAFEFGVNEGILPNGARYVLVDCARYEQSDLNVERDIFGENGRGGAVEEAAGGVVFITRFDHLSHSARELLLRRITENDTNTDASDRRPPARFLIGTARSSESSVVKEIARSVPIVVQLPSLVERTVEERTQLALHFLRMEGRRVAADIQISRGALRALSNAVFEDNVDGLRSTITNCCASAYLNREDDELVIHTYNLPSNILGAIDARPDDDQLVSGDKGGDDLFSRIIAHFQRLLDPVAAYREGTISFNEFMVNATLAAREYGDFMNFESQTINPRIVSYEQLISPIVEEINRAYGIELTRRISRSIAQSLLTQLMSGEMLASWRQEHATDIKRALGILAKNLQDAGVIVDQITIKVKTALGLGLDDLSLALLYVEVADALRASGGPRDFLGVIMCHGYSTATSIADAADRILRQHVFEAIDMTYEQDVSDAVGQLSRLFKRFSHCQTIAVLVDMGSLEQINDAIVGLINCDVHVANNVSTALALEVGSALIAHENLDGVFERVSSACVPSHTVVRCTNIDQAMVFCSELGIETADKIRQLVQDSIPGDAHTRLITCDFTDLQRNGVQASIFASHRVRVLVGTRDPGIAGVPFVALEDILYQGGSDIIDDVLLPSLGPDGLAEYRANLLRNLTLRNVLTSITILNPETLYVEADHAVQRLCELSGEQVDPRRRIGVYVHLCGLIERLVTRSFVDTYPDIEGFVAEHMDFVGWFREAFDDMTRRYRVEIPVSEIAYVHHMLHMRMNEPGDRDPVTSVFLEDE